MKQLSTHLHVNHIHQPFIVFLYQEGLTPLMMVAKGKRWITAETRTSMVDILLKANADLNTQENVR